MFTKSLDPELHRFINRLYSVGTSKSLITSVCIAKVYVQKLQLPLTPTGQLQTAEYFDMNLKIEADLFLSKINEIILIDKQTCLDLISRFYSYRAAVFFSTFSPLRVREDKGLIDFFCLDRFFDPVTLETIDKNGKITIELMNGFSKLFEVL